MVASPTLPRPAIQSTYTRIPDIVLDELMAELSGSELKVLLYVARRTIGFRKRSDAIALSQFTGGITTRDGRQLDRGTGLSREMTIRAVQSLESKGYLLVSRALKRTSRYTLRLPESGQKSRPDDEPVAGDVDQNWPEEWTTLAGFSGQQQTVSNTTDQETVPAARRLWQAVKDELSRTDDVPPRLLGYVVSATAVSLEPGTLTLRLPSTDAATRLGEVAALLSQTASELSGEVVEVRLLGPHS